MFASDFYIVQVEGNDWKKASRFLVRESLWTKLGQPFWVEREQLVRTLEEGYIVEVLLKGETNPIGRRLLLTGLNSEPHFNEEGKFGHPSKGNSPSGTNKVSLTTT